MSTDYEPECGPPDDDDEDDPLDPDARFTCWCGVVGTFEEMFDDATLDQTCGGMGTLYCHCGGDQCVCHYHGQTQCDGCEDCELDDEYAEEFGIDPEHGGED